MRGALAVLGVLLFAGCGEEDPDHVVAADGTTVPYQPQPDEPNWGSPGGQEATGGKVDVPIRDGEFSQPVMRLRVGQIVVFTNDDDEPHTVRSVDGELPRSDALAPGGRYEFSAKRAGIVRYECVLHPEAMRGELRVRSAGAG